MNTYVVLSLDTRVVKKDGSFPLLFRITHKRKTIPISTGFSILESEWDEKRKMIKSSYKGIDTPNRINNLLQSKKSELLTTITKLYENGKLDTLNINELKHLLTESKASKISFLEYTLRQTELLKTSGRYGSARAYRSMYLLVQKFCKGKDIPFEEITSSFLRRLEADFLSRGNSLNGLAALLRALRAVYNKAVKDKYITDKEYPFKDYKIRKTPTIKRAISKDAIQSILSLQLDKSHPCFNSRNYFLFSYLSFGMNYTDMARLKVKDMTEGRLKYVRQKTKQVYDVKIVDAMKPIIDYYIQGKTSEDYIFPIIKRTTTAEQYNDVMWSRKEYNIKLKELAELCGITENLTSYVSRHSAATSALYVGVPVNAISKLLGHSSLSVTETYLKSLPDNIIDSYHEKIADFL